MTLATVRPVDVPFDGNIWEGVYSSFDAVPRTGDGFAGNAWDAAMLARARLAVHPPQDQQPPEPGYAASLLPVVAALTDSGGEPLRIVDFGGGPGMTFAAVRKSISAPSFEYHVVEMPNVCELGARTFADDPRIRFQSTLPELPSADIVHFGSSIQYVDDWKDLLRRVAAYRPQALLFTELMAGDVPTYATGQNYYGSIIPMWFFNFEEFRRRLADLGFRLALRASYPGTYLGKRQPCPQDNFSPEYRIGYASHALFRSSVVKSGGASNR